MAFVSTDLASLGTIVSNSKQITFYIYDSSDDITAAGYFVNAGSTSGTAQLHAGDLVYNPSSGQTLTISDAAGGSVTGQGSSTKKITIGFADGTTETDTAWDIPSNALVREVYVNVTTAEATGTTKTVDIGLLASESGGNADGFIDGLSVATTGVIYPTLTTTATWGVLLLENGLATSEKVVVPHDAGSVTAKSISWTPGSNDFAELAADIYIVYDVVG
jgi:hypothetical protein